MLHAPPLAADAHNRGEQGLLRRLLHVSDRLVGVEGVGAGAARAVARVAEEALAERIAD